MSEQGKKKQVVSLDSLKQINLNAAGLDIGDDDIYVCVPESRDAESVRSCGTFTVDLPTLADWLETCGVTTVAMESTGVYWIPVFEVLADRGFEVNLINARHIKNVPGKKSDVLDCQSPKGRRNALDPAITHLWIVASLLSPGRRDGGLTDPGTPSR